MAALPAKLRETLTHLRDELGSWLRRWRRSDARVPVRRVESWDAWLTPLVSPGGPPIEIEEDDEEIRVRAELPGFDEDDFEVILEDGSLVLRGEKQMSHAEEGRGWHYSEWQYGAFARRIPLPAEVEEDRVQGRLDKGILEVRLPKSERARPRRIPIRVR